MDRFFEKYFEHWISVTPEFERYMNKKKGVVYADIDFVPKSVRLYAGVSGPDDWGLFYEKGDVSIHWSLAALNKASLVESACYLGNSLVRDGAVKYVGIANYGHAKAPITSESLTSESFFVKCKDFM